MHVSMFASYHQMTLQQRLEHPPNFDTPDLNLGNNNLLPADLVVS